MRWKGREPFLLVVNLVLIALLTATTPFLLRRDGAGGLLVDLSALQLLLDTYAATFIGAVGMTLVILAGQIDLSVGSALALCAVIVARASQMGWPIPLVFLASIGMGTLIGLINGTIVAYGRIHAILVTLGMMTILRGLVVYLVPVGWVAISDAFRAVGLARPLGISTSIWIAGAFALFIALLMRYTRWGHEIYAVGSNPSAATIIGIRPHRVWFIVLLLNGFTIGLAGAVYASHFGGIQNSFGQGFELLLITAVVIGGTSIFGGYGSVWGTLLGVLFLALVRSALIYFRIPALWEQAVYGAFLLFAVGLDIARTRAWSRALRGGAA
ncbi:ABC transporter permease [Thermoflexus sp.]|uniref:ABC transporter permease n=1 Tax=Thermoflexus sp. TaxID=1969742 RepID=UPI0035E461D0